MKACPRRLGLVGTMKCVGSRSPTRGTTVGNGVATGLISLSVTGFSIRVPETTPPGYDAPYNVVKSEVMSTVKPGWDIKSRLSRQFHAHLGIDGNRPDLGRSPSFPLRHR